MVPAKGSIRHIIVFALSIASVCALHLPIKESIKGTTKKLLGIPLNFTELTAKNGYQAEEHTVTTKDGYILTLFRIRRGVKCLLAKQYSPVILMHGLLQSSDAWIDAGPRAGLPYLISNECIDIWVANCRGNHYSKKHLLMNPDKISEYWDFTIEEIGKFDVPALIDYVLEQTKAQKVNYIGFSQGAGTFFVMCSERPEYCNKANVLVALAPATRHTNTRSPIFRLVSELIYKTEGALRIAGIHEVLFQGGLVQQFFGFFCKLSPLTLIVCRVVLGVLDGFHPLSVTKETAKELFDHFPAGTSVHNMARYGQSMRSEYFSKFDYGKRKNLLRYGSEEPPLYNLSATTIPVAILYGRNDGIVDVKDIKWLAKKLPNLAELYPVADPLWTHLDMSYSQHNSRLIFPKILKYLKQ